MRFCAIIDAHVHADAALLPYLGLCVVNARTPKEYVFLKQAGQPLISAGIHPWDAATVSLQEMEPILREAAAIGEIGLDCVWCDTNLDVQRAVFHRQLQLAAEWGKPVILHTKGMEREVLETIRRYPNRYLVHWYSQEEYLEDYIRLGCWFTVGPQLEDAEVCTVAKRVPYDRLLMESDGLEGLRWGQNRQVTAEEYPCIMDGLLENIAELRGENAPELAEQMKYTLQTFLQIHTPLFK